MEAINGVNQSRLYKLKIIQLKRKDNFEVFLLEVIVGKSNCVTLAQNPVLVSGERNLEKKGHLWREGQIFIDNTPDCIREFWDRVNENNEYFHLQTKFLGFHE